MKFWTTVLTFAALAGVLVLLPVSVAVLAADRDAGAGEWTVIPAGGALRGRGARQQLIVSRTDASGADDPGRDLTGEADFSTSTPAILEVSPAGVVSARGSGRGLVAVRVGDETTEVSFDVTDGDRDLPVDFEIDVEPIMSRGGCNSGPCHGKARGQNGFQLSLLGFDADFDHAAITHDVLERRIVPAFPETSLFLLKPTGTLPHGGGVRVERKSDAYAVLERWIASGAPRRVDGAPVLEQITVFPTGRELEPREAQQLLVTARYSDGTQRDVTHLATYLSSESAVVGVDEDGRLEAGSLPGEAAIMARFMGNMATSHVTIPLAGEVPDAVYAALPRQNLIDDPVWQKLRKLGMTPSAPANDATFLRRAYLDAIGCLPQPDEVRSFLADTSPRRREHLVDALLERPEYGDFWANKWADLLRPNPYRVGIKTVFNYDAWIRAAFRKNMPYDRFVRELLTARGSTFRNGAVTLFRDRRSPDEITTLVSQLFLGVRLECARCHHHPFEKWSQDDFYGFAAYFSRIGHKGAGLSPPISGGEEMVFARSTGDIRHPRTGKVVSMKPLVGEAPDPTAHADLREVVAGWIVAPENPFFAPAVVNRVWADLMGRGIVEPVDDFRATNPPTNGPLLDALAAGFRENGHDLKWLLRTIMTSYVYGLSFRPGERNVADTRNYSRHYRQRLRAEVLLDLYTDITGIPERFAAMPPGSRAMEVWTHRTPSLFLDTFGRPDPNQDPPCLRVEETSVTQALHLLNSPALHTKVTSGEGRAAVLAAAEDLPAWRITEELYLRMYSRFPTDEEMALGARHFEEAKDRRQAVEDLMWAMLNTPEFLFKN